jgi:1-acyl-sn-glycerol-3-phosphate acyltransferase
LPIYFEKHIVNSLVAVFKLVKVVAHLLMGLLTVYAIFPKLTQAQRNKRIEVWASAFIAKIAIKLVVNGTPPSLAKHTGGVLMVSNHISWLDILVIHAAGHCRFVSKADIKHWPILGTLTTAASTLYIERESRRDAMRVVHHMSEALADGDIVAVFPEGTTGNGIDLLPFHANLLQAAIAVNAPIQPLALSFIDSATGQTSQAASYVGDETLLGSLWRTLKSSDLVVVVNFGVPQWANARDRRTWAADLRTEIASLKAMSPSLSPSKF